MVRPQDVEPNRAAPYEESAAGLERAAMAARINRLNPRDRLRVLKHLEQPIGPQAEHPDDDATEIAMAKLRHPSVARILQHRQRQQPATPGPDPAGEPTPPTR